MIFYPGAPDADVAQAVQDAAVRGLFSGGHYTTALERLFTGSLGVAHLMPTPSCTAALGMACRLAPVGPGDEVILPSYNFPAAGNAALLAGATPVLCDIDPATQNLSVPDVERRITPRTRAVIAVHYAAVAADMERLGALCRAHGLTLIEDAAQAVGATLNGRHLGGIGRFGCYSFHATKVFACGEGGALVYGPEDAEAAALYRDNGTNREAFLRGDCLCYAWQGLGESMRMSELSAAALYPQLVRRDETIAKRLRVHRAYDAAFRAAAERGLIQPMAVPEGRAVNGHMYYVRFRSGEERDRVRALLGAQGIEALTHYVPLHLSPMGAALGYRPDDLPESRRAYETLLRLPIHERMSEDQAYGVAERLLEAVRA
ncbi:aminotransferase class I/II-fold pyridoxal phosphate-dependent enzyme [Bacillota bacterium Meth-B3]